MAQTSLYTCSDIRDSLLDWMGSAGGDATTLRKVWRAMDNAYREISSARDWTYNLSQLRVSTVADYSTGTVTYDHCVTPEHEALTREGWKTYGHLKVGDEILAYDHDTEMCSWQPIQKIHTFDYDGKILDVRRKGRSVLRCTPNHRVPVYERYGHGHGTPRKLRKKWVLAKDLTLEQTTPLAAPIDEEIAGPLDSRIAALLSWCVTDGHATFKKWVTPRILQSPSANPEKCDEIAVLTGTKPFVRKDGCHSYPIYRNDARKFKAVAKSKDDLIPLFCHFGVQQAEAAIRAMILAEASTNPKNGQKVFTQWGDNKPVAEAFQIACLLAGKATNISVGGFHCKGFGKDYGIRTRYQCPVRHGNGIKLAKRSEWVPYRGIVWCPQVRTGGWVVRCNGAVMITGNSGGANERMLTLATGTWPTWAAFGVVQIDNVEYQVATRESSTIITLSVNSNPGADVAAGTSYQIYRDTYPLPVNFGSVGTLRDVTNSTFPEFVDPNEFTSLRNSGETPSVPRYCTVLRDPHYTGSMGIRFLPPPDDIYEYDAIYRNHPRQMSVPQFVYTTGTISSSSTTITGVSTAFTNAMIGAVIRTAGNTTAVTGKFGTNPYTEQRIITARTSATALTIDAAFDTAASAGSKYEISDPIDIEALSMYTAFLRRCEYELGVLLAKKEIATLLQLYKDSLILAFESDNRSFDRKPSGGRRRYDVPYNFSIANDVS